MSRRFSESEWESRSCTSGLIEKLADPGRALLVVEKYDPFNGRPVDPGLWVVGAGVTEIAVGWR